MITEIRKTISGTEYWDSKEKRSLFVPTGEVPGFEVTENPESIVLVDESESEHTEEVFLDDMTVKELREYAAELNIEIPSDVKKKEDIIELLS
ncbi:Rho termination factor N-terminal domain-containing protein [Bacillus cereus]|uniref:Rho termination factor N-terminal domain-containing protein n=1 Tax=Bacillus cereus TaxID=1396 RepID=UPI002112F2D4|nr:Rho termination factor N-terminal domain-containing protein [Bacillus cereus]